MTALEPITGPSVWHGGELMQRDDWIVTLDAAEIAELETAAKNGSRPRADGARPRRTCRCPRLDARLEDMRDAVVEGCGFALMRGLPVDRVAARGRRARLLGHRARASACLSARTRKGTCSAM